MEKTSNIRSVRFRQEREEDLTRLETLVTRSEKRGLKNMSFEEARDLAALYRQAISSLAIARVSALRAVPRILSARPSRRIAWIIEDAIRPKPMNATLS